MPERGLFTIAVLGGTGQEGSGLAFRWAHAGHRVILGSRDADKAARAAGQLSERVAPRRVEGRSNKEAAAHAEVVVLTVPYAAQRQTVEEVRAELVGKILIDVTVPLVPRSSALALLALLGQLVLVAVAVGGVEAAMARLRLTRIPQLLLAVTALVTFATILLLRRA